MSELRIAPTPGDACDDKLAAADDTDVQAITVAVHGTFAGHADNHGQKWWQSGSAFAETLRPYLPRGVRPADGDEVFHWSGDNSERARSAAAAALLAHLESQEAAGKAYHLVGHSHGGSVIWHALKLAEHARKPLAGLRSWTTVGTPFLQHSSRGALSLINVVTILLTLLLLKPAVMNGVSLFRVTRAAAVGARPTLIVPHARRSGYQAVLGSPFFCLMRGLGVPMAEVPGGGLQIGTYTPESPQSFAAYLFASREGLTVLGVLLLSCYTFTVLTLQALAPALESHRIRAERNLELRAFERFGGRWLGVWSEHDEAIHGLRATLGVTTTFVRNMMPRARVFVSDTPSLLKRPIVWLVAPLFNRFIRPAADKQVRQIVTRAAQGNDRPTAELVAVTPTPVDAPCAGFRPLPREINDRLRRHADREARDFAPKLRELLCQPSFSLGADAFGDQLTGRELIHTSYFDHEEVAAMIGCNVSLAEPPAAVSDACRQAPYLIRAWIAHNKAVVGSADALPAWLMSVALKERRAA
ncbi:MAG: hypothetical protein AAGG46_02395 [Planctomycetota bacterium]